MSALTASRGHKRWRRLTARPVVTVLCLLSGVLLLAALARADVVKEGDLEVAAFGHLQPYRLPRDAPAPISVFISGHLSTTDGTLPPQLQGLTILLNRHGVLRPDGLPTCRMEQIQPASTERALNECGNALIGSGQFWAEIVLPGQAPYATSGRLLAFNGLQGSQHVVFVHIFTTNPFFNSFVITFSIRHVSKGRFGTELQASLPQALGSWGFVNRIKMILGRKYQSHGHEASYFNASCPAAKGFPTADFELAQATFHFAEGKHPTVTLTRPCAVRK